MSESIRIRTSPNGGDKYVKVKIDHDIDFVEILSLSISQDELYQNFCSDYGVVAGRVIINSGFGVPNAKVSIFIPIDEVDKGDVEISGLYPYDTVTDKNSDGVRYNLLSRQSSSDNDCFTPVGSFPSKREVLDNSDVLEVYCKYYRFTTTTNYAGDFMIFGVPLGTYTLHVDADISDIGIASQRPYDFTRQGSSPKFFDSPTKFKGGQDLNKLIQIKSADVGVNVQPFWGDMDNCEIGITRVDIDLNYSLQPCAIFMGSIYGDQDKNSVNKNCIPRKKLGELCEQVTSAGSVEIIRKNIDNEIEEFSVEGGRLIDDDGTWAFQIPMNLDYMITDESGQLVLSEDPNKGIPTRANVRFRIGMDETGGEGRLRTRAKYLVPNNPQIFSEIDYNFDENTKPTSFRDIYWNKIYTVSNFISRYQRSSTGVANRNITAMKDVDACAGDKNPFPYNKVNTTTNPIFFIICLLIKIIAGIVILINFIIIPIINGIISIIRTVVDLINAFFGTNVEKPSYVPCVTIECPPESGTLFAPGCREGSNGYDAARSCQPTSPPQCNVVYGCGGQNGPCLTSFVGVDDCLAFQMAEELNMFQFDFYNDWVTGTLLSYLLKYKKVNRGREKFCEFDCADFTFDPNYSGVDGNGNGVPDNDCKNFMEMDTCYNCGNTHSPTNIPGIQVGYLDCQKETRDNAIIREGLIKKYKNELYYAATTHSTSFKLFATDLVCLGSVFTCDWQGYPKLQPRLVGSTYKLPPETEEVDDDNTTVLASGQVTIGNRPKGLFFDINCVGLHVDYQQCLNLRHICEVEVGLDEAIFNPLTGAINSLPDGTLGSNDIDNTFGKQFRDSYLYINSATTFPVIYSQPTNINSDFNISTPNAAIYDFSAPSPSNLNPDNGVDYANFRGYNNQTSFDQPKHSFFMYFGTQPGRSALDKMNQRFFTTCVVAIDTDMVIDATATTVSATGLFNGQIIFTIVGSQGPYSYTIIGPNGYTTNGSISSVPPTPPTVTVTGLEQGTYIINVLDVAGNPVTQTVVVGGPASFFCSASVTQNNTSATIPDGEITLNIGGGTPPYSYTLLDENGSAVFGFNNITVTNLPVTINNLSTANVQGYTLTVTDSANSACTTTGLTISGPNLITITPATTNSTCYVGSNDGSISLTIAGAQSPYTVITSGASANNSNFYSNSLNMNNLSAGNYLVTVYDGAGSTASTTVTLASSGAPLTITSALPAEIAQQCYPNNYTIYFRITNGLAINSTAYMEYRVDNSATWNYITLTTPYVDSQTLMSFTVPISAFANQIIFRFSDTPNHACHSNIITYNVSQMPLPNAQLSGTRTIGNNGIVTALGGIQPYTCSINNGQPQIMPNGVLSNVTITALTPITITDSVGCTALVQ